MPPRRLARRLLRVPARLLAYSREERALLLHSAVDLVAIDRTLKRSGYEAALTRIASAHRLAETVRRIPVDDVARIVDAAARWTIGLHASCLRRAILLTWLLRSAGVACDLVAGVGRPNGRWSGHAWVEVDGVPFGASAQDKATYVAFRAQLSRPDTSAGTPRANSPIEPS